MFEELGVDEEGEVEEDVENGEIGERDDREW